MVVLVLWGWLLTMVVLGLAILRHHGVSIGESLWVCLLVCDSEWVEWERTRLFWEADGLENIYSRALRLRVCVAMGDYDIVEQCGCSGFGSRGQAECRSWAVYGGRVDFEV